MLLDSLLMLSRGAPYVNELWELPTTPEHGGKDNIPGRNGRGIGMRGNLSKDSYIRSYFLQGQNYKAVFFFFQINNTFSTNIYLAPERHLDSVPSTALFWADTANLG